MADFPKQLFVTGTDTDVGKTLVSAVLMAGLKGTYWKPVQSGAEEGTDTDWVREKTGLSGDHFLPEAYRLEGYFSPHRAAALSGAVIDLAAMPIPPVPFPPLIVEGAGGVMVPLNDRDLVLDLIGKLDLPVLLVARSGLGTINHTLLTLAALKGAGIDVLGVVLNGPKDEDNKKTIARFGKVSVVGEIPPLPVITPETLAAVFTAAFQ